MVEKRGVANVVVVEVEEAVLLLVGLVDRVEIAWEVEVVEEETEVRQFHVQAHDIVARRMSSMCLNNKGLNTLIHHVCKTRKQTQDK